jgi:hypothetical protein
MQIGGQGAKGRDVVGMFVSDEDAVDVFRDAGNGGETLADLASAKAGVNQKACFRRFQIRAVASRTAAQNRQLHRHALTLEGLAMAGNPFLIF